MFFKRAEANFELQNYKEAIADYNSAVKTQMKLVMFLDACEHVSRIERIIR